MNLPRARRARPPLGGPVAPAHRRGPLGPRSAQIAFSWVRGQTLLWHLLWAALSLVGLWALTRSASPFHDYEIAQIAYLACAAAGLTVLVGLNGQISLGHGAFMGVGAYTTALLLKDQGWNPVPVVFVAIAISGAVGALVGSAAARLRGPYLAGATLAFAVGLPSIVNYPRIAKFLGGNEGLTINTPGPPGPFSSLSLQKWQAWFCGFAAVVLLVLLANLSRSRVGRQLRAVRDDEVAASLCGLWIARVQILAFVVSAAAAGLAGALLAMISGTVAPGAFTLLLSLSLLSAIILGGLGSLVGAVYGSIVLVLLPTWAGNFGASHNLSTNVYANIPLMIYGAVLVVVMLVFPLGIQGGLRWVVRTVGGRVRALRVARGS